MATLHTNTPALTVAACTGALCALRLCATEYVGVCAFLGGEFVAHGLVVGNTVGEESTVHFVSGGERGNGGGSVCHLVVEYLDSSADVHDHVCLGCECRVHDVPSVARPS